MTNIVATTLDGRELREVHAHPSYAVSEDAAVYRVKGRGGPIPPDRFAPLTPFAANSKSRKPHVRLDGANQKLDRLVALAWLPVPKMPQLPADPPELTHKDGDKWNCAAQNLEWK